MLKVAFPLPSRVPEPSVVPPSVKVTAPVATVVPDAGVTVAVKVTDCPALAGLADDLTIVVLAVFPGVFSICVMKLEMLELNDGSPLKVAWITCGPGTRFEVWYVAVDCPFAKNCWTNWVVPS